MMSQKRRSFGAALPALSGCAVLLGCTSTSIPSSLSFLLGVLDSERGVAAMAEDMMIVKMG